MAVVKKAQVKNKSKRTSSSAIHRGSVTKGNPSRSTKKKSKK